MCKKREVKGKRKTEKKMDSESSFVELDSTPSDASGWQTSNPVLQRSYCSGVRSTKRSEPSASTADHQPVSWPGDLKKEIAIRLQVLLLQGE